VYTTTIKPSALAVWNIYSNVSGSYQATVYQGGSVLLTTPGAYNGQPTYTFYRWFMLEPGNSSNKYLSIQINSSSTGTTPLSYDFKPPFTWPIGTYQFKLQVKDQAGDVANSSSYSVRVLAGITTTVVPMATNVIVVPGNSINVSETFTISNLKATEIAYANTVKSIILYTNSTNPGKVTFQDQEIKARNIAFTPPTGYVPISYDYFQSNGYGGAVIVNATLPYPYNISFASIFPFQYTANGWRPITGYVVSPSRYAITFTVQSPVLVALMQPYQSTSTMVSTSTILNPLTNSSVTGSTNSTTNSTKNSTPVQKNPSSSGGSSYTLYIGGAAILVAIFIAVMLLRQRAEQKEYNAYKKKGISEVKNTPGSEAPGKEPPVAGPGVPGQV
jgi:hypothetical protein